MGSNIHAQSVRNNAENLLGMISMEMIGYYDSQPGILQNRKELIVSGIRKYDDFNIKVSELLRGSPHLDSRRIVFDDDFKNNGPSDHRNYWPLGVPAVMIIGTGGSKNLNYHKETDTIDTLDFTTMTIAVEQIYKMISGF